MLIIGIRGINVKTSNGPDWTNLRAAFREVLPDAKFVVEGVINCRVYDFPSLRRSAYAIVENHDTGEDIVLAGGSAGGIIALLVAVLLKKSRVILIATFFSPHTFLWGLYRRLVGAKLKTHVPIITFQVVPDRLVWWGTRHPQSLLHTVLHSNVSHAHKHALGSEPHHARLIARTIKEFLPRPEA